jgi:hypothetical protein
MLPPDNINITKNEFNFLPSILDHNFCYPGDVTDIYTTIEEKIVGSKVTSFTKCMNL